MPNLVVQLNSVRSIKGHRQSQCAFCQADTWYSTEHHDFWHTQWLGDWWRWLELWLAILPPHSAKYN